MTMILQWQRPAPPLLLAWQGPDGALAALSVDPTHPISTVIGPPGIAGPAGPPGPAPDLSTIVIDGGVFT